jgi:hypothetical protein
MSTIKVNTVTKRTGSTLTLGESGTTVTLACGATQSGFGRSGSVNWQTTPKTATFTAVNGEGYFANTSGGAFTMNLPAGSAGAIVAVADYTRTFQTNNLTISPNGSEKIGGVAADLILNVEGQALTLVYVDGTEGWINVQNSEDTETANPFLVATGGTITTCGNDKIHTFTGSSTFTVSKVATCSANNQVSYLVVGGGGGGGATHGGGAGAGGFREDKSPITPYTASPLEGAGPITVTATTFPITVGGGGVGATPVCQGANTAGAPSTFSTITSAGGGKGSTQSLTNCANAGGSGGGGTYTPNPGTTPGGAGNTPPVSPPQGSNGGDGGTYGPGAAASGGGGGATAAGADGTPSTSGAGGAGAGTLINPASGEAGPGPSQYYGGGGAGGATIYGAPSPASGGIGGGGDGQPLTANSGPANIGAANTGGGGGGGSGGTTSAPVNGDGSAGGSGIVIIRYKFQ